MAVFATFLLIVPEGIEIFVLLPILGTPNLLLIVPEGIEIKSVRRAAAEKMKLLIVPEGIEIRLYLQQEDGRWTFNRTRRN